MTKLTALIEAAKAATPWLNHIQTQVSDLADGNGAVLVVNPATILELCALLEKAEDALLSEDAQTMEGLRCAISIEALAAIKQWKEQT